MRGGVLALLAALNLSNCGMIAASETMAENDMATSLSQDTDLIFIHGYGGSACSWQLIKDEVSQFSNPAFIELVGFGNNAPPEDFDFTVDAQAQYLARILRDAPQDDATLVAHSYGAAVLLVAMLDHGVDASRIVLVDPLAYQQDLPFFIKGQIIPVISPISSYLLPPSMQVDIVLNAIYADKSRISDVIRRCYISEFSIPFHRRALGATARELSRFDAEQYVSRYSSIDARVHIVWGQDDPLLSSRLMPRLQQDLKAESAQLIEGCGHAPHEECPNDFVVALRRALSD